MRRRTTILIPGLALAVGAFGCGGGQSNPTSPVAVVTPTPTPTPTPGLVEPPGCHPGGDCPGNTTPVARATLRLYALLDPGGNLVPVPGHDHGIITSPIRLDYTCRMDLTGRDANGVETNGVDGTGNGIVWYYSDPSMIEEGAPSNWQRKLRVVKTGQFTVFAVFDGVGSNDLTFTFIN
jgi:hypothetical protein